MQSRFCTRQYRKGPITKRETKKVDQKKQKLDALRPLPPELIKKLGDWLKIDPTYKSNAIEGNTLSSSETAMVVEKGLTIAGKTVVEHLEAINHKEAILFVEGLVKKNSSLSEWDIKSIHQLILKSIDDKNAGVYRKMNVTISGAEHIPPDYLHVQTDMEDFITWYMTDAKEIHPVERAARVHADFVKIHPFVDGNGRTARLLMNLELMKDGYPPVVLPVDKRLEYYESLDTAHVKGDYSMFLSLMSDVVEDGFKPYWFALGLSETGGNK